MKGDRKMKYNESDYGAVVFDGKEYQLTGEVDFTSRILPGNMNYHEVALGEKYKFEMSAPAIDAEGNTYTIYWIFKGVKGEDDPELDSYDYDNKNVMQKQSPSKWNPVYQPDRYGYFWVTIH